MAGIRLRRETEPQWVDLGNEAGLLALPPTTLLVGVARIRADAIVAELLAGQEAITKAGGTIVGGPDLGDEDHIESAREAAFILSVAEVAVIDWKNVLSAEGTAIEFDVSLLGDLLSDNAVAQRFMRNYMHPLNQVAAEGNG